MYIVNFSKKIYLYQIEHNKFTGNKQLTRKRRECVLLIVDVVSGMEPLVKRLNIMQLTVHPINAKLNESQVHCQVDKIHGPADFAYGCKTLGPAGLDHVL